MILERLKNIIASTYYEYKEKSEQWAAKLNRNYSHSSNNKDSSDNERSSYDNNYDDFYSSFSDSNVGSTNNISEKEKAYYRVLEVSVGL